MQKLKQIKLIAMDVDGVLTDGSMIFGASGDVKIFNVLDGLGIRLAMNLGVEIVWISGNTSEAIERRAHALQVTELHQGQRLKSVTLQEIAKRKGLSMEEIAYIGDDLNDLPAIELVRASFAVANASSEVKNAAEYVTDKFGGHGAVREVIEMILKAQGRWDEGVRAFLENLKREQEEGAAPWDVN